MLGTSVGNYQVASLIGTGGMGAVYLARHSMLGRAAAVKVLLPEMSQKREVVNRFFNEARAATAIRHPGIVEIYDFGVLPDNSAYIIMEMLEGETLGRRLHQVRRLSVARALQFTRQIAGALQAAHEQQIIHRDLKPDNLFLVKDPESKGERIKLLDFGIAKLASESGTPDSTVTGTVMGTPRYMSPEQCRGAGAVPLDARSDLYSLGCILYQMICGRPPFIANGEGDIIAHHIYFQPDLPTVHCPTVPPYVEQLMLRLLAKEPGDRPASAAALIALIDAFGPLDAYAAEPTTPTPLDLAEGSHASADPIATHGTTLSHSASEMNPLSPTPQTVSLKGSASQPAPEPIRGSRKLWWGAAAALAAAAATTFLLTRSGTRPENDRDAGRKAPTAAVVPAAGTPATTDGAPTARPHAPAAEKAPVAPSSEPIETVDTKRAPLAAPPAELVLLQVTVSPQNAPYRIYVDEEKIEGTSIEIPKSRTKKVAIKVVAKGYQSFEGKLLPSSDLPLSVVLIPEKRTTPRTSPSTTPSSDAPGRRVIRKTQL